jgi:Fe-S cluster assembly iron-binding protein IscA
VRLEVVWKPDAQIEVSVVRNSQSGADHHVEADGLRVVMADSQKTYLKGARIALIELPVGIAFDVTFPNRDARDRELASQWLRSEQANRKPNPGKDGAPDEGPLPRELK